MKINRAIFLDRDGTLIRSYSGRPANTVDEVALLPEVAAALTKLGELDFMTVVISNQGGIGEGYTTAETVKAQNERLNDLLIGESSRPIDAFYWCPHKLREGCNCRKPNPGLLYQAATDLNIYLSQSYFVGDDAKDMDAACRAGIPTRYMVVSDRYSATPTATAVCATLLDAAKMVEANRAVPSCR